MGDPTTQAGWRALPRARLLVAGVAALVAAVTMGVVALTTHQQAPDPVVALRPVGKVTQLPLRLETAGANQVITVVAGSRKAATAQLQAWSRVSGGWVRMGPSVTAHTASGGLTATPAESVPATPLGSYSITQAFGRLADPGTPLPYIHLTAGDWWISQPGPLYNTHQFCTVACPFALDAPNTHLIDTVRAYTYAVVIDYNRFPVVQDAGSAYFLHVTTAGKPTRGCIAVSAPAMIALLRWLRPSDHPRILIGIG